MSNKSVFTNEEKNCLTNRFVFPDLTSNIIKKIEFKLSDSRLNELLSNMKDGYGSIVPLNEEVGLMLQYHGRFESFLIGMGINDDNPNQPDLNLLRIDTSVEKTHKNKTMAFLGENKLTGPHFHWYNSFYRIFTSQGTFNLTKPTRDIYSAIIKIFLEHNKNLNFNSQLLEQALPYPHFVQLCNFVINKKRQLREDGYITIHKNLKKSPNAVLNQILNRELF